MKFYEKKETIKIVHVDFHWIILVHYKLYNT